jgi:large subunit ribosomal protein L31
MKKDIHPKLYKSKIHCTCGFEIETWSTRGEHIEVEICSNCHPFYTGKQRFVDTAGRIDRFRKKYGQVSLETKKKS